MSANWQLPFLLALWSMVAPLSAVESNVTRWTPAEIGRHCVAGNEKFWRSCEQPPEELGVRTLFAYALALAEARQHPERFERLFQLAAEMQDRNPKSRTYGNFRWYRRDATVLDKNAVDFCMRGGALLWLKHRDFIPAPARARLRELLVFGTRGCLGHKVSPAYSNIAIMNAGDLILLGEALDDEAAAAEGYKRLAAVFDYARSGGIHEFVSPTYTGVDLDGLGLIEAHCRNERGRAHARALLELLWTDIAANWFPAAERYAGSHSRSYDYLRGRGYLDVQLALNGWITNRLPTDPDVIYAAQTRWRPPAKLRALSGEFPRVIHQTWGTNGWQFRTHAVWPEVTLGSSAVSYGGWTELPLTVDLPGDRESVRGYFIADGRRDPYGVDKIAAGPHRKALHLDPFWCAAQRGEDALGLAVYRAADLKTNLVCLDSNFVLPADAGELRVNGRVVSLPAGRATRIPVPSGAVVTLRQGTAAVGLRVPWATTTRGDEARVFLVRDAVKFKAVRLVAEHSPDGAPSIGDAVPGLALWIRVGHGLNTPAKHDAWQAAFTQARATVEANGQRLRVTVPGERGEVVVHAAAPWEYPSRLEPPPRGVILEVNGTDRGAEILNAVAAKAR